MSKSYYFLVAGLPDLLLDEGKNTPSFSDFMAETEELVCEDDRKLLKLIKLPFDNANLITILENSGNFDTRGNYSKEELTASVKSPENLPRYMQTFLEAYKDNQQLFPGLILRDQLNWLFFDEVTCHPNQFIRDWFTFELNLRNLVAGINSRKEIEHLNNLATERDRPISSMVIGRNDEAELIIRSNAPDFSLSSMLPWTERVINLGRENLTEFEKGLDTLRWDILNELTCFSYFQIETILAFSNKLIIVERWKMLDSVSGKEKLDFLTEELRASFSIPEDF